MMATLNPTQAVGLIDEPAVTIPQVEALNPDAKSAVAAEIVNDTTDLTTIAPAMMRSLSPAQALSLLAETNLSADQVAALSNEAAAAVASAITDPDTDLAGVAPELFATLNASQAISLISDADVTHEQVLALNTTAKSAVAAQIVEADTDIGTVAPPMLATLTPSQAETLVDSTALTTEHIAALDDSAKLALSARVLDPGIDLAAVVPALMATLTSAQALTLVGQANLSITQLAALSDAAKSTIVSHVIDPATDLTTIAPNMMSLVPASDADQLLDDVEISLTQVAALTSQTKTALNSVILDPTTDLTTVAPAMLSLLSESDALSVLPTVTWSPAQLVVLAGISDTVIDAFDDAQAVSLISEDDFTSEMAAALNSSARIALSSAILDPGTDLTTVAPGPLSLLDAANAISVLSDPGLTSDQLVSLARTDPTVMVALSDAQALQIMGDASLTAAELIDLSASAKTAINNAINTTPIPNGPADLSGVAPAMFSLVSDVVAVSMLSEPLLSIAQVEQLPANASTAVALVIVDPATDLTTVVAPMFATLSAAQAVSLLDESDLTSAQLVALNEIARTAVTDTVLDAATDLSTIIPLAFGLLSDSDAVALLSETSLDTLQVAELSTNAKAVVVDKILDPATGLTTVAPAMLSLLNETEAVGLLDQADWSVAQLTILASIGDTVMAALAPEQAVELVEVIDFSVDQLTHLSSTSATAIANEIGSRAPDISGVTPNMLSLVEPALAASLIGGSTPSAEQLAVLASLGDTVLGAISPDDALDLLEQDGFTAELAAGLSTDAKNALTDAIADPATDLTTVAPSMFSLLDEKQALSLISENDLSADQIAELSADAKAAVADVILDPDTDLSTVAPSMMGTIDDSQAVSMIDNTDLSADQISGLPDSAKTAIASAILDDNTDVSTVAPEMLATLSAEQSQTMLEKSPQRVSSYSSSDRGMETASIAALDDGGYVIAWSGNPFIGNANSLQVFVERYDANGQPIGDMQSLDGPVGGTSARPEVNTLSDGAYVVTWQAQTSADGLDIFAQHFDASNAPVGGLKQLRGQDGNFKDADPEFAAMSDGGYVLSWVGHTASSVGPKHLTQRYGADGTPIGGIQEREARTDNYFDSFYTSGEITALANGHYIAVWHATLSSGFGLDIHVQRYDENNDPVGGAISHGQTNYNAHPDVTALTDGGYVLAWRGHAGYSIKVQRYDSNDDPVGSIRQIHGVAAVQRQGAPLIEAMPDGGYVIAWTAPTSGSYSDYDMAIRRFDANDNEVGSLIQLEGEAGNYADGTRTTHYNSTFDYQLTVLSDGGYAVVWRGYTAANGSDIFLQRIGADHSLVGEVERLQTRSGNYNDELPQIAELASGALVAVWQGQGYSGSYTDITHQIVGGSVLTAEQVLVLARLYDDVLGLLSVTQAVLLAESGDLGLAEYAELSSEAQAAVTAALVAAGTDHSQIQADLMSLLSTSQAASLLSTANDLTIAQVTALTTAGKTEVTNAIASAIDRSAIPDELFGLLDGTQAIALIGDASITVGQVEALNIPAQNAVASAILAVGDITTIAPAFMAALDASQAIDLLSDGALTADQLAVMAAIDQTVIDAMGTAQAINVLSVAGLIPSLLAALAQLDNSIIAAMSDAQALSLVADGGLDSAQVASFAASAQTAITGHIVDPATDLTTIAAPMMSLLSGAQAAGLLSEADLTVAPVSSMIPAARPTIATAIDASGDRSTIAPAMFSVLDAAQAQVLIGDTNLSIEQVAGFSSAAATVLVSDITDPAADLTTIAPAMLSLLSAAQAITLLADPALSAAQLAILAAIDNSVISAMSAAQATSALSAGSLDAALVGALAHVDDTAIAALSDGQAVSLLGDASFSVGQVAQFSASAKTALVSAILASTADLSVVAAPMLTLVSPTQAATLLASASPDTAQRAVLKPIVVFDIIASYAASDGAMTPPSQADLEAIGITGLTTSSTTKLREIVATVDASLTDSVAELQAIVDGLAPSTSLVLQLRFVVDCDSLRSVFIRGSYDVCSRLVRDADRLEVSAHRS